MLRHTRRFIKDYLPGTGAWYSWGLLTLVFTIGITLSIPILLRHGVSILAAVDPGGSLSDTARHSLLRTGIAIAGLGLLFAVTRSLSRILIFTPGRRIEERVRQEYFATIASLPPGAADHLKSGDLISRGTSDIQAIRVSLSMAVLHSVNMTLMLGGGIAIMLKINPLLTVICLVPAPLMQFGVKIISRRMMDRFRRLAAERGELTETIRETFSNHTLMTIYPAFKPLFGRFEKANLDFQHSNEYLTRLRVMLNTLVGSIAMIGQGLLLAVGGRMVLGGGSLGIPELVAFSAYLVMMIDPLQSAGWMLSMFQRGETALERVYAVLDLGTRNEQEQAQRAVQTLARHGSTTRPGEILIAVRNLQFGYSDGALEQTKRRGDEFQLSIPELDIQAGQRYGIFGSVGCGKSTLINILNGNIPVARGMCRYRDMDYLDIRSDVLLREFSVAPQESRHFAKTIRENIDQVLRNPGWQTEAPQAGYDQLFEQAFKVSQLGSDVDSFPAGLDTLLGENGINLSGGQRQRLALFRALVKPHRILFLDDIVSSIDHHTESQLLRLLYEHLSESQTLLLISHRISALMPCDEIWIMEHGRIVAQGSHTELLEQHETYRRSFEHQALEQAIEKSEP